MEEFFAKLLAEAPLAAIIGLAMYWYRPILSTYLSQQAKQLELIADAMKQFNERLDRVEQQVNHIAEATEAHAI